MKSFAVHTMTAEQYCDALQDCGCFEPYPPETVARLRKRIAASFAENPERAFYSLAIAGFDMDGMLNAGGSCSDRQARGDCCSYRCALRQLAINSQGHFRPQNVADAFDRATGIARVSFEHDGEHDGDSSDEFKPYLCEIPLENDWFDPCVLDLVNDAMELGGSRFAYIPLPFCDHMIYLVLMSQEAWSKARSQGLIPPDDYFFA